MENYNLVRPEHLNHHGSLFGGQLLSWVDECAWMAAATDYPQCRFVTRAMDRIEFKHQVQSGSIVRFSTTRIKVGKTSVQYLVEVYEIIRKEDREVLAFSTTVTFVSVDDQGNKKDISTLSR